MISPSPSSDRPSGGAQLFWPLSALCAAAFFLLLIWLGLEVRPLMPVVETRLFSVAWEMWRDSNFILPELNGELYSQKPPLLMWLIHLLWALVGVTEYPARFIAPAFGVFSILMTGALARRLWPDLQAPAILAPWILATSAAFIGPSSLTMYDAPLTAMVLLALYHLLGVYRRPRLTGWIAFGLALGLGFLFKGPAIAVHVLPLACFLPLLSPKAERPDWRGWFKGLIIAGAVSAAVAAVWLLPAIYSGGFAFLDHFVWNMGASRVVEADDHQAPFWLFAAFLPVYLWPWGWFLPLWRALFRAPLLSEASLRFCLFWLAAAFLIHSGLSGKQFHYLLPELPALALLFARVWPWGELSALRWRYLTALPLVLIALAGAVLSTGLLPLDNAEGLLPTLPGVGIALACLAVLLLLLRFVRYSAPALAAVMPAGLLIFYSLAAPYLESFDSKKIAALIAEREDKGAVISGVVYHGDFTFTGRLTQPVPALWHLHQLTDWAARHPGGLLISKTSRTTPDLQLEMELQYRGRPYNVWVVPEAPSDEETAN